MSTDQPDFSNIYHRPIYISKHMSSSTLLSVSITFSLILLLWIESRLLREEMHALSRGERKTGNCGEQHSHSSTSPLVAPEHLQIHDSRCPGKESGEGPTTVWDFVAKQPIMFEAACYAENGLGKN